MVMSFFRRNEDIVKTGVRAAAVARQPSVADQMKADERAPAQYAVPNIGEFEAFGSVIEENKLASDELLGSLSALQERVSSLLGAHSQSLSETGALRAECARIGSLLDYESGLRRKADQDNQRLTAENKEMRLDNGQLRIEVDALRDGLVKLQGVHELTREELTVVETRLVEAERELSERTIQFDEATALLRRAQQDLDQRTRELSATREKLDVEMTAHQLLIETSRRENGVQQRELARLAEERNHLKSSLAEQELAVRNLQGSVTGLKQSLALVEDRYRRLEAEHESLQSSTALEIAGLKTRHDAIGSKAELVEKLLATANARNKMTDEELQSSRNELKRVKSELATALSRIERMDQELHRARLSAGESEAARRDLAAQNNELTLKLRDLETQRGRRERELDTFRRDRDSQLDSDRQEIAQLRTSLEIARSEIRQLRAECAILNGQLDVARGERAGFAVPLPAEERPEEVRMPPASPLIEISSRSLRASGQAAGSVNDEFATMEAAGSRLPAE
jgi:chromosome segregation ATPase